MIEKVANGTVINSFINQKEQKIIILSFFKLSKISILKHQFD